MDIRTKCCKFYAQRMANNCRRLFQGRPPPQKRKARSSFWYLVIVLLREFLNVREVGLCFVVLCPSVWSVEKGLLGRCRHCCTPQDYIRFLGLQTCAHIGSKVFKACPCCAQCVGWGWPKVFPRPRLWDSLDAEPKWTGKIFRCICCGCICFLDANTSRKLIYLQNK